MTAPPRWGTRANSPTAPTVVERVLRARGMICAPGTKIDGSARDWQHAVVVDATTGEPRGERWAKLTATGWLVRKEAP
jgi:hypothetical protein